VKIGCRDRLAKRGALVLGVDANKELLTEARRRILKYCEFRLVKLRESFDLEFSLLFGTQRPSRAGQSLVRDCKKMKALH
jgi:hypothetical protein